MSKSSKQALLTKCPDCGSLAGDEIAYRCGSTPWSQSWTCLKQQVDQLRAIVDTLPVSKDEVPLTIGMSVWVRADDELFFKYIRPGPKCIEEWRVCLLGKVKVVVVNDSGAEAVAYPNQLCSTKAAAEAAKGEN